MSKPNHTPRPETGPFKQSYIFIKSTIFDWYNLHIICQCSTRQIHRKYTVTRVKKKTMIKLLEIGHCDYFKIQISKSIRLAMFLCCATVNVWQWLGIGIVHKQSSWSASLKDVARENLPSQSWNRLVPTPLQVKPKKYTSLQTFMIWPTGGNRNLIMRLVLGWTYFKPGLRIIHTRQCCHFITVNCGGNFRK